MRRAFLLPESCVHTKGMAAEDLLTFIRDIHYVLLTRGIEGTHLYVCDPALREHLSRYIEVVE